MIRYIHGSQDSLDVDVYYVFDKMPSFQESKVFCSDKEENRNIIVINDGIVTDCFKGTVDEINNGLIVTYPLHKQEYPLIVERKVERDSLIKTIRVLRCLISHCSRTQYRTVVKEALKNPSWQFKINTLKSIDFNSISNYGKGRNKEDIYKVFAFQLGQAFGLFQGKELYTKSDVANEYVSLRKYLYREENTDLYELIRNINLFLNIISKFTVEEKDGIMHFEGFNKSIDLKKEVYI